MLSNISPGQMYPWPFKGIIFQWRTIYFQLEVKSFVICFSLQMGELGESCMIIEYMPGDVLLLFLNTPNYSALSDPLTCGSVLSWSGTAALQQGEQHTFLLDCPCSLCYYSGTQCSLKHQESNSQLWKKWQNPTNSSGSQTWPLVCLLWLNRE